VTNQDSTTAQNSASNHVAPCGQCCRRDILLWKTIAAIDKIGAAIRTVEDATDADKIPPTLMRAIHAMSRAMFEVRCQGHESHHAGIIADEIDQRTVETEHVDLHGQTVTQRVSVRIWIEGDDSNTVGGTMSTTEGPIRLAAFFASTWRRALQRFAVSP
jgi:hypothetical protein